VFGGARSKQKEVPGAKKFKSIASNRACIAPCSVTAFPGDLCIITSGKLHTTSLDNRKKMLAMTNQALRAGHPTS
jgi:hypothetical protein